MEVISTNISLRVGSTHKAVDKDSGMRCNFKVIREATLEEYMARKDVEQYAPLNYFYLISFD